LIQGAAFEPELVELMGQAYETACKLIGANQPPLVMETIAKSIIDSARVGTRDPQKMVEFAMRGLERFPDAS
jgi:hypothetical protein